MFSMLVLFLKRFDNIFMVEKYSIDTNMNIQIYLSQKHCKTFNHHIKLQKNDVRREKIQNGLSAPILSTVKQ